MQTLEIAHLLDQIELAPTDEAKAQLLRAHGGDPDFIAVLKAAYNPLWLYDVRRKGLDTVLQAFRGQRPQGRQFNEQTWRLLDRLVARHFIGDSAYRAVSFELGKLDLVSAHLLRRILSRDLECGITADFINKSIPGCPIPRMPYMQPSSVGRSSMDAWCWQSGVIAQELAQGLFVNVTHMGDRTVTIATRDGVAIPPGPKLFMVELVAAAGFARDSQTHGVLRVYRGEQPLALEESDALLLALRQGNQRWSDELQVRLMVWDQIPLGDVQLRGQCATPYSQRLANIAMYLPRAGSANYAGAVQIVPSWTLTSRQAALERFFEDAAAGRRGIVLKDANGGWQNGRSRGVVVMDAQGAALLE